MIVRRQLICHQCYGLRTRHLSEDVILQAAPLPLVDGKTSLQVRQPKSAHAVATISGA
jgi:hypothetical protein